MKILFVNDEKKMNNEIVKYLLGYHNSSFLAKNGNQAKNEQVINLDTDALIHLRNNVSKKKIPKDEKTDKIINIIEEILDFNK